MPRNALGAAPGKVAGPLSTHRTASSENSYYARSGARVNAATFFRRVHYSARRIVRFLARLTVFGALAYSIGKVAAVTLRAALDDPTVYGCIGFVAVVVLVATFRAEFRDVH